MPQHNAVHRSTHAQKHLVAALSPLQQNLRQGNHPAPLPSWVVAESVSVTGSSTDFELVYVQRSLVPKLSIRALVSSEYSNKHQHQHHHHHQPFSHAQRRFLAKAIRGPEPGAQVLEPLHPTRTLGPPPDVYLHSLLSSFVFLYLSVCEALKLRPLPFTHPVYVAPRSFQ